MIEEEAGVENTYGQGGFDGLMRLHTSSTSRSIRTVTRTGDGDRARRPKSMGRGVGERLFEPARA